MTLKGQVVQFVCTVAVESPLRRSAENLLLAAGRRFPTSHAVQSFARHFGASIMRREGSSFERIATFSSGGRMRCGPNGHIGLLSLQHYFLGTITGQTEDERPIVQFLNSAVRPGDVFFDVGANLGFYSLYVGPLCGMTGAVHAFEANPTLIAPLQASIALNIGSSQIHLNPVAVGRESNQNLRLYDPERVGCSSFYAHGWLNKASFIDVPVVMIDDYVSSKGITKIDGMKIDIEGAELEAFLGMDRTFEECPPAFIICELMPSAVADRDQSAASPTDIIVHLGERGYRPFIPEQGTGKLRVPAVESQTIEQSPQVVTVVFAHSRLQSTRPDLFQDS